MTEVAQYSHENKPMQDILSEIRAMVSREANARYVEERKVAKRELLILRPEARVDLLLQEADADIVVPPPAPEANNAAALTASLEADVFNAKLQEALGVSTLEGLEGLIRKVLREELQKPGSR